MESRLKLVSIFLLNFVLFMKTGGAHKVLLRRFDYSKDDCNGLPQAYWAMYQFLLKEYVFGQADVLREAVNRETVQEIDPLNKEDVWKFGCSISNARTFQDYIEVVRVPGSSYSEQLHTFRLMADAYRRVGRQRGVLTGMLIHTAMVERVQPHRTQYLNSVGANPSGTYVRPSRIAGFLATKPAEVTSSLIQGLVDDYGSNFLDYAVMYGDEIVITDVGALTKSILSRKPAQQWLGIRGINADNKAFVDKLLHEILNEDKVDAELRTLTYIDLYSAMDRAHIFDLKDLDWEE